MLKRFLTIFILATTAFATISSSSLLPVSASEEISPPIAELSNTQLSREETVLQDVKPIKSKVSEVYEGFISSDKIDSLKQQPEAVLQKAGIRVPSRAKIEFSGETNVNRAQRRRTRVTIIIFGDGTVVIIVRQ
ncbi:hypothetical protein NIES3974_32680 [Calothrix sp. NIES-3974]|nr:hypothetical protein NIES3974_32680 [Calothrix sp. NIES-3974]